MHTFDGDGPVATATITADKPLCPGQTQPVTLVAYTAPDDSYTIPQYLLDADSKAITRRTGVSVSRWTSRPATTRWTSCSGPSRSTH
jgi:hypothetical protein